MKKKIDALAYSAEIAQALKKAAFVTYRPYMGTPGICCLCEGLPLYQRDAGCKPGVYGQCPYEGLR